MGRGLALLAFAACSRPEAGGLSRHGEAREGERVARPAAFAERSEERRQLTLAVANRVKSDSVLHAMRTVPRHAFVPGSWAEEAYRDRPLPIGHGQTISQPTVVAAMTEAAAPQRTDKCLEIGTGSGYQAAVLAELCARVFSIEYLAPLAHEAERTLRSLGYGAEQVALRTGDGYVGWPEAAPFEVVLVTAAPEQVPQPLLEQLAPGGRLVIPVGPRGETQQLRLYRRVESATGQPKFEEQRLMPVRFVPFLGR
jgi:protein-L-isoaspartate(D-aspartate) O-methyltransferase